MSSTANGKRVPSQVRKDCKMYVLISGVHGVVRKITWEEAWGAIRKWLNDPSGIFGLGISIKMSL